MAFYPQTFKKTLDPDEERNFTVYWDKVLAESDTIAESPVPTVEILVHPDDLTLPTVVGTPPDPAGTVSQQVRFTGGVLDADYEIEYTIWSTTTGEKSQETARLQVRRG